MQQPLISIQNSFNQYFGCPNLTNNIPIPQKIYFCTKDSSEGKGCGNYAVEELFGKFLIY